MKKLLFSLLTRFFIYIFLISNFIYFISTTKNTKSTYYNTYSKALKNDYINDPVTNVSNFITDSDEKSKKEIENSIINFMQDVFTIRNDAFFDGNVEKLYRFYNTDETFSAYSLEHEFKRIAFLRNWANEKNVTFKNISSIPTINGLKIKNGLYDLTLSEKYKLDYFYNNKQEELKTLEIELIHTLELKDKENSFIITEDYYDDYFNSGLDNYNFNLTEKNIP